jgi:hypothetical protein
MDYISFERPRNLGECDDALRMIADTLDHPRHLRSPVM